MKMGKEKNNFKFQQQLTLISKWRMYLKIKNSTLLKKSKKTKLRLKQSHLQMRNKPSGSLTLY